MPKVSLGRIWEGGGGFNLALSLPFVAGARPNAAHRLLAQAERLHGRVAVLTQNVDGLHQAAGSSDVVALHGDLSRLVCCDPGCGWAHRLGPGHDEGEWGYPAIAQRGRPPPCPRCGGPVRPRVVLFGEMLHDEAVRAYGRRLRGTWDVSVAIGTSGPFPYVVDAALCGRASVEINPEPSTALSPGVDVHVPAPAGEALEVIYARVKELRSGGLGA